MRTTLFITLISTSVLAATLWQLRVTGVGRGSTREPAERFAQGDADSQVRRLEQRCQTEGGQSSANLGRAQCTLLTVGNWRCLIDGAVTCKR